MIPIEVEGWYFPSNLDLIGKVFVCVVDVFSTKQKNLKNGGGSVNRKL